MNLRKLRIAVFAYVLFDLLVGGICGGFFPLSPLAAAQTNAVKNESSFYGNWAAHSTTTIAAGTATMVSDFCYFNATYTSIVAGLGSTNVGSPHQFFPYATNVPITIVDGANTETVTPSSVVGPTPGTEPAQFSGYFCSFTATFANAHQAGVTIVSADAGVAEAANDNGAAYEVSLGAILLQGSCTGTAPATAGTYALAGVDPTDAALTCAGSSAATVSTLPGLVVPRAAVLKTLSVTASHAGTSSSSGAVTVNVNGTATALTCTIGTGTSCADTTHSVSLAAGAIVTITYTDQTSDVLAGVNAQVIAY